MQRTWQAQFPDYPVQDMPAIPAHWTDESWEMEPCPQFCHQDLQIFCDYLDPAKREWSENKRFAMFTISGGDPIFETNTWSEVLDAMFHLEAELYD